MYPELLRIGPYSIGSYTLLLNIAILTGLGLITWRGQLETGRPLDWFDAGLAALVGGVIGGRAAHVAVHMSYFSGNLRESWQIWHGGLLWHGAIAGGLLALLIYARLLGQPARPFLDGLSWALPLAAFLIYSGCLLSSCGHGREIASLAELPAPLALELPDLYGLRAPRLASQVYGMVLSILLLAVSAGLGRLRLAQGVAFWLLLGLLGLGAFGIGFTRGDAVPMLGSLRLDQLLDLLVVVLGFSAAIWSAAPPRPQPESLPDSPEIRVH